eukprot:5743112-Alexandrium_andersonii.AAC.1
MAEASGHHPIHLASGKTHARYSSMQLLECVRLRRVLKGGARHLVFVVERAIRIAFPGVVLPELSAVPSPSALH